MRRRSRQSPLPVNLRVVGSGLAVLAALVVPCHMASSPKQPDLQTTEAAQAMAPTVDVTVRRIELQRLLGDRAELVADVEVLPHMNAVLRTVRFRGLWLDGRTPVYMAPLGGEYTLQSGRSLLLPKIQLAVFYSDLPTPSSMHDMLAAHHVEIRGEVRAGLQLSLAGKLLTRDLHPVVALQLRQNVPFDEAAVDAPTQLGIGVLAVAERAVGASASVVERLAGVRVQVAVNPVSTAERDGTVLVRTTYRAGKKGAVTEYTCERLGFWVDKEHVLVPAEVLAPWAFSTELAQMATARSAGVDASSVTTVVDSADSAATEQLERWGSLQQEFTVERQGHPLSVRLLTPGGQAISVLERESEENYALLRYSARSGRPQASTSAQQDEVNVLRRILGTDEPLRRLPIGEGELHTGSPLPRPVDQRVFGSPVRVGGTIVGMVSGETTWVPLSVVLPAAMGLGIVPEQSVTVAQTTPP